MIYCLMCFIIGTNKLESVLLNKANFEVFAKDLLLVKRFRIEIYQQNKSRAGSGWAIAFKVSKIWY